MTAYVGHCLRGRWDAGSLTLAAPAVDVAGHPDRVIAVRGRLEPAGDPGALAQAGPGGARGVFAAVVWDRARRTGYLVRDPLGGHDVFYARTSEGGVVFADEVAPLLDDLPAIPSPDEEALTAYLGSGIIPVGRTLYAGVLRLPPGHLLPLRHGAEPQAWWRLRPQSPIAVDDREALAELVVGATRAAVGRAAGGARGPGVLVSGGLDSSTVLALLAEERRAAGAPRPVAYSAEFPAHPETDESALIDDITRMHGVDSVRTAIRGGSALAGSLAYLRRWRLPATSPNSFLWGPLLDRAAGDGCTVMLDGEGGDEVFGMQPYYLADLLRRGRWHRALRLAGRIPGMAQRGSGRRLQLRGLYRFGVEGAVPSRWQHVASAPQGPQGMLLAPEHRATWQAVHAPWEWKRGDGPLWHRRLVYALTEERELLDAHGFLRRRAAAAGLDSRHPFLHDVELLETCVAIPPERLFDAWLDRPLLRRGMAGRLPDSIRLRFGKSHFTPLLQDAVGGPDAEVLRTLLLHPGAEVRRWLDPSWLERLSTLPGGRVDAPTALQLFRAGSVECWLQSLADPDWPTREILPLVTRENQAMRSVAAPDA